MPGYYTEQLAAERLRACYDLAGPRVQQYLEAEIQFVLERVSTKTCVLELGCGYGRVLKRLVSHARSVTGIDTSLSSLRLARTCATGARPPALLAMDATRMGFHDQVFDLTICIQNGICAFAANQLTLMKEAIRVTRPSGRVLFSSYAAGFWTDRLAWFEQQAAHGLIGPIDYEATDNGVIVCGDGLRLVTMDEAGFQRLSRELSLVPKIMETDGSSIFCEILIPDPTR